MTALPDHRVSGSPTAIVDHALAGEPAGDDLAGAPSDERHYACLAVVSHLRTGDCRSLRTVSGVTGVVGTDACADTHVLVCARSPRAARRRVVALIAEAVPHAVVTVPDVVDYDTALLEFLARHSDDPEVLDCRFDDCLAVADALDRLA